MQREHLGVLAIVCDNSNCCSSCFCRKHTRIMPIVSLCILSGHFVAATNLVLLKVLRIICLPHIGQNEAIFAVNGENTKPQILTFRCFFCRGLSSHGCRLQKEIHNCKAKTKTQGWHCEGRSCCTSQQSKCSRHFRHLCEVVHKEIWHLSMILSSSS
jgi:hypothetical protein